LSTVDDAEEATYDGIGLELESDGTIVGGGSGEYCAHWWDDGTTKMGPHKCEATCWYGALCESPSRVEKLRAPIVGERGCLHY
jgi:hypothetical protein